MSQQIKRRFSLEEDFMNYGTDDLIYGFMRSVSTVKPGDEMKEYLTVGAYKRIRPTMSKVLGVCTRTINNRVDKMLEKGLLKQERIKCGEKEILSYTFPYDFDGLYKLIEMDMLNYLVNTRNSHSIRIYLYLLNCSSAKSDYVFTVKEIRKALGYTPTNTGANEAINCVLESFQREGIIKIESKWFEELSDDGEIFRTERKILKFIAKSKNELPKVK